MEQLLKIDLSDIANNKLIYGQDEIINETSGLDGSYFEKEIFTYEWNRCAKNLFKISDGFYDNVECNKQSIYVNENVKAFHFLGFFFWGNNMEHIIVEFDNGDTEVLKVMFGDWTCVINDNNNLIDKIPFYGSKTLFAITTRGDIHIAYFHHSRCELKHKGKVKRLILPENMFMHIFAITAEN